MGSDVSAIRTKAVRDDDHYVINGQKMWLTNGATSTLVAVLCRTDDGHDAPHRNMTTFLIEKEPGFGANPKMPGLTVPGKIEKMGYKGVDTTELILQDVRIPADRVLGGSTGQGFYQMMDGVEVGRVNVAARGCAIALRAFELGIAYAQRLGQFEGDGLVGGDGLAEGVPPPHQDRGRPPDDGDGGPHETLTPMPNSLAPVPGGPDAAHRRRYGGDPEDDRGTPAAGGVPDRRLAPRPCTGRQPGPAPRGRTSRCLGRATLHDFLVAWSAGADSWLDRCLAN